MALTKFKFIKIKLDRADMTITQQITAKAGAVNGNGIELQLVNGSIIEDTTGVAVYLNWKHQTAGNQGSEPFTLIDATNGIYRVTYPTELLSAGFVNADIKIVDGSSITMTTQPILIKVAAAATDSTVQSANAWNDIQTILTGQQAHATRLSALEAAMPNKATKPTNESTASANQVLAANGGGTSTFKNIGEIINSADEKTTPVDADKIGIADSAASNGLKRISWANIKAAIKTYLEAFFAPLISPTFTGTPAAPTAAAGTNTTQIATTAFVKTEIAALVDSSPSTLDTLNELAAALGDDPNFATTMATQLGLKANKSTELALTLSAASWVGASAPYTYALTATGVTTTSNQEILPATAITSTELAALQAANIQDAGQAANTINLKAFGAKPTVDIPIRVILRGDK